MKCTPWAVTLLALAGCSASAPLRVEDEGYDGVILPADAAGAGFVESEGTWVPTAAQVRAAESRLAEYVRREAAERAPDWRRLRGYHRQYLGTIHGGRRCIYVKLVLRACWEEDVSGGFDGGDAYVQAEFDAQAGRYLWLGINGEA